ncbi:hypothetical protein Dimus_033669 [Dionaea muscipula]
MSFPILLLVATAFAATSAAALPTIGVTYRPATAFERLPPPEQVAAAIRRLQISSVRLPGSDSTTVRAFSYSNISLFLSIPNAFLPAIAANRSNALAWLYHHVVPFYPRARISAISVGIDALNAKTDLSEHLLPAVRNVHIALHELGIRGIAVSTTFSFVNVLTTAFPPSSAEFNEPLNGLIIKPLLEFLQETNSSFFINLHPYHLFKLNPEIPIGFALFQENPFSFRDDFATGVRYRNLFDTMVDAVISAMTVAGHESIPVVVAETGWPSAGKEADANQVYAEMFLRGLVRHLRSGLGTPLRKEGVKEAYVYELFDKQNSRMVGGAPAQQWGVLYPNLTKKYDVDFGSSSMVRLSRDLLGLALGFYFIAIIVLLRVDGPYGSC